MGTDYGKKYKNSREALLGLLSDLEWHTRTVLERVAGNRYTARLRELRRLGYSLEDRDSLTGHGKDYRLLSLSQGEPEVKRVKAFLSEADTVFVLTWVGLSPSARASLEAALSSFRANKHRL